MRNLFLHAALPSILLTASATAHAAPPTELCNVLHAFVGEAQPGQIHSFTFHTSWGTNFKQVEEQALSAKRCDHGGDPAEQAICAYLMKHGQTEFADMTVMDSISCLSSATTFDKSLRLHSVNLSFRSEGINRGATITVTFGEDTEHGGMVFRLQSEAD
ncbi:MULTISPECIES: hypothetical protein [Xanthomonas]|uniref:Secreted protein n=2 Tax=Xanthomonas TaxID=338 RepID=A0A7Z7IX24_XANCH|nr:MULTISPECIES: hypothetical protein [Xanthomonas]ATS37131.1 hypothetical protein XcfCFBP6988P_02480 [Xanthomonas citri pv. phaseoli var. fuscans]ATS44060.1 hypothetical protein XcfCFBP6989P_17985 [Xanthomonas citri pv. phaseoli var. fuscans]ATS49028.1 hypothetical protein XcfCFBP6990P_22150 [Xanthomonas citri pv. phaseoli var. fuscans]ATS84600.1 hypothetical protein XcfCFBP6991P_12100 [Xanthomonas citri pv. phaseoli var. fuscans]QWN18806.1 hypothetical protein DGM98_00330 [Xanthomonas citri]